MGIVPDALGEPFASKAQQHWAFWSDQPWAKEWADKTNFKRLPERVRVKKSKEGNGSSELGQLMRGKAPSGGTDPKDDLYQERDFDPNVGGGVDRDKLSDEDFAGPDRSFPIVTQADVSDAFHSLGRTKHNKDAVRAKIISIAKRKGFKLPDSASKEVDVPVMFGRGLFMESF
jgi:hypothetical protein